MDKPSELPQPRVIAQVGDNGENGSLRLIWVPPRPYTEEERHARCAPEGAEAEGRVVVEAVEANALGELGWWPDRHFDEDSSFYPLILKLHTAYEEAWAQRESIAAHSHDMFEVLRKDAARVAELVRKVDALTDRVASGPAGASPAARAMEAVRDDNDGVAVETAGFHHLHKVPAPRVATVPDSFPTIDIEEARGAGGEIQSALGSLGFAPPEGQRMHIARICDSIQVLANALGLKPPSELSPPVARLIEAARALVHSRNVPADLERLVLADAVAAWEAQT